MKNIIIFASGSGSNAENIIQHFKGSNEVRVVAIFSNNSDAGVLARAAKYGIPAHTFTRSQWTSGEGIDDLISSYQPDCIVLAGFLWLFQKDFCSAMKAKYSIFILHYCLNMEEKACTATMCTGLY